jgi:hypothetical protein
MSLDLTHWQVGMSDKAECVSWRRKIRALTVSLIWPIASRLTETSSEMMRIVFPVNGGTLDNFFLPKVRQALLRSNRWCYSTAR